MRRNSREGLRLLGALLATAAITSCGDGLPTVPELQTEVEVQPLFGHAVTVPADPTFLYAFRNANGHIEQIDVPTGAKTFVGPSGFSGATGMATSEAPFVSGTTEYPAGTHVGMIANRNVILIDTETGDGTLLVTTNRTVLGRGIAFGSDGKTLYLIEANGAFSTIDLTTGVITLVKSTTVRGTSLDWDPFDHLFYTIYNRRLYGIREDGTIARDVALTGTSASTPCTIARRPDDNTWYTLDSGGLYSLDLVSGVATRIGTTPLGGLCGTAFAPEHAINEPPTGVTVDGPYVADEGTAITMTGTGVDPEGGAVTFHWNFGDGNTAEGNPVAHAYGDEGVYTVTLTARDEEGIGTIVTTTATIANVDPLPTMSFSPEVMIGDVVELVWSFTDPGFLDSWLVFVTWGDGALDEVTGATPGIDHTSTHVYTEPGVYMISVMVNDLDGGAVETTGFITVTGDITPPEISVEVDGTLGDNGWYVSDVTVDWTVLEPESLETLITIGCVDTTVDFDTTGETSSCEASSQGGEAGPVSVTVMVDQTAPDITFTGDLEYDIADVVNVTCSATDATSGIAVSDCPGASGDAVDLGAGTHTLFASATDAAGNSAGASATLTITVSFDGVCALVERYVSHHGVANSLCAKLRAAARAKNANAARGPLSAFISEVEAQSGKKIDPAHADILVSLANGLMP